MTDKEFLDLVIFFKDLKVEETDVTTEAERNNGQLVVTVKYQYKDKSFTTAKLYYKDITTLYGISHRNELISYFGSPIYWLDIDEHDWPQSSGKSDLEKIVINEIAEPADNEFKDFLYQLANNPQNGKIQLITQDGRSGQYYHNLENNNHWHDLIRLIQAYINSKGEEIDKAYYSRLVFKWDGGGGSARERATLTNKAYWCSRSLIDCLRNNIRKIQPQLQQMELKKLLEYKKQIILQGPPGTGKTYTAKDIAEQIIYGNVTQDKKEQKRRLEATEQFKLVQFHPAFTYEDFVRGIEVKTDNASTPEYTTVNKILGEFAQRAYESSLVGGIDDFDRVWYQLIQDINDGKVSKIGSSEVEVDINTQGNVRFKTPVATYERTYELYRFGKTDLKYETYNKIVLNYLKDPKENYKLKDYVPPKSSDSPKRYVLIIDEINRANLPAVLGELIYALEYRGERVDSMYSTKKEGNALILPSNLYIMGTMNTADRSVGHIDYAIRRRFAFVDILPSDTVIDEVVNGSLKDRAKGLYNAVAGLFTEKGTNESYMFLASDFKPYDVQLGHSYFLAEDEEKLKLKLEYEIKPILREYVQDGVLLDSALPKIESLSV